MPTDNPRSASAYAPYPGFRPLPGLAAENNGKLMINPMPLRGSRLATPSGCVQLICGNFFGPAARWQFSGVWLARDTGAPA